MDLYRGFKIIVLISSFFGPTVSQGTTTAWTSTQSTTPTPWTTSETVTQESTTSTTTGHQTTTYTSYSTFTFTFPSLFTKSNPTSTSSIPSSTTSNPTSTSSIASSTTSYPTSTSSIPSSTTSNPTSTSSIPSSTTSNPTSTSSIPSSTTSNPTSTSSIPSSTTSNPTSTSSIPSSTTSNPTSTSSIPSSTTSNPTSTSSIPSSITSNPTSTSSIPSSTTSYPTSTSSIPSSTTSNPTSTSSIPSSTTSNPTSTSSIPSSTTSNPTTTSSLPSSTTSYLTSTSSMPSSTTSYATSTSSIPSSTTSNPISISSIPSSTTSYPTSTSSIPSSTTSNPTSTSSIPSSTTSNPTSTSLIPSSTTSNPTSTSSIPSSTTSNPTSTSSLPSSTTSYPSSTSSIPSSTTSYPTSTSSIPSSTTSYPTSTSSIPSSSTSNPTSTSSIPSTTTSNPTSTSSIPTSTTSNPTSTSSMPSSTTSYATSTSSIPSSTTSYATSTSSIPSSTTSYPSTTSSVPSSTTSYPTSTSSIPSSTTSYPTSTSSQSSSTTSSNPSSTTNNPTSTTPIPSSTTSYPTSTSSIPSTTTSFQSSTSSASSSTTSFVTSTTSSAPSTTSFTTSTSAPSSSTTNHPSTTTYLTTTVGSTSTNWTTTEVPSTSPGTTADNITTSTPATTGTTYPLSTSTMDLTTTDMDECALQTHSCHTNAVCNNTDGSYTCTCEQGYTGNGFACTDVDECSSNTDDCDTNAACTNTDGNYTCTCLDGYTGDGRSCSVALPNCYASSDASTGFPFSYGPSVDYRMPSADEICRTRITVNPRVPFQGNRFRNIYVCPNGLVCFGRRLQTWFIPLNGERRRSFSGRYCLAPYFSDLITYRRGNIYYRYIDAVEDTTAAEINIAKDLVAISQNGLDITPTFILVTATFQVIYVTDGSRGYSFYFYKPGGMNINNRARVFIGLILNGLATGIQNNRFGSFLRRPDINLSIRGCQGQYEYIDDEAAVEVDSATVCMQWYQRELPNRQWYLLELSRMPRCPCRWWFLFFDRRFRINWWDFWWFGGSSTFTAYARPSWRYWPHGEVCEYSWPFFSFTRWGRNPSSFARFNPLTHPQLYESEDAYYKRLCCEDNPNLCHLYQYVRPSQSCYTRFPFRFSWLFGDPHITTLDSKTYTFNGHDEYLLLNVTSETFEIQCRTGRAIRADGNISFATVFTAFVVSGDNVWVQAELDANGTSLVVFAGENKTSYDDYTEAFNNNSIEITDDDLSQRLTLERSNDTLMTTFLDLGISFNVTLGKSLLTLGIGLPETLENMTEGLLGNFNNDPDDDFRPRYASQSLMSNITDRTIFEDFGQTWKTSESESKFKYDDGKSRSDYATDFVPHFIEEANQTLVSEAEQACGQDQVQCIFDYVFTGDAEIAQGTLSTQSEAGNVTEESQNETPTLEIGTGVTDIEGEKYLYVTLGQNTTFEVTGTDDGSLTYQFMSNDTNSFASINPDSSYNATVSVYVDSVEPKNLSITVVDNKNVYGEAIDVIIVLCTGCNSQGSCDLTLFREDNGTTDNFRIATCECEQYWEGDDCEIDIDGCENDPCSEGRNCTDKNATVHKNEVEVQNITNAQPYYCSDCPEGFVLDDGGKCEDIDECNVTNGNCSQTCENDEGTYACSCSSTFRLASDGLTCDDINECDEATSGCDQLCNNTVGGFECYCYTGYVYNTGSSQCQATNTLDAQCSTINCTSAAGCTLNSTDNAVCFCDNGYDLQPDNSCSDTDECTQNVCSQTCSNAVGSFTCGCFAGFQLSSDKVSCEECDFPYYGENCNQTCTCGRGYNGCDNVRGCICKGGWTGTDCDTDANECTDPNICGDVNKVCTNTVGSYKCTCRSGYTLQGDGSCADSNECQDATLNNCSQLCINTEGGFTCGCRNGFTIDTSDDSKCSDIDECNSGVSSCQQNCVNTKGSYRCECYFGFLLNADRKTCAEVSDPCILFPDVNCSHICRVIDQQAVCLCNVGYQLGINNQSCIDINECDTNLNLNLCSEQDTCFNTKGGYTCSCSSGYKLESDGRTCTACDAYHWGDNCANNCSCGVGSQRCDSVQGCVCGTGWSGLLCDVDNDECSTSPRPCTALNQQCINTPGSYYCACLDGYQLQSDGNCYNIDECSSTDLNLCAQICTDTIGSYTCSCQPGFVKNGTACDDIDECSGQHGCSQICSNTLGSYRCSCEEGFKLVLSDRQTCIPSEECVNQTLCGNNATCTSIDNVDTCSCDKGFEFAANSITICIDIEECTLDPDLCSQLCVEMDGGYQCVCNESGYSLDVDDRSCIVCNETSFGDNCTEACNCSVNSISCNNVNGSCTCEVGWEGATCSDDIDECTGNVCPQNATCVNSLGSYSCECDAGFIKIADGSCQICSGNTYGINCAQACTCNILNTDACDPVSGACTCKTGWTGSSCTDDIDECINATICGDVKKVCSNTNGSFICNCKPEYILASDGNCEDINECNLGTDNCIYKCLNTDGSFECDCSDGYSGSGNNCTVCEAETYGTNCTQNCSCVNSATNVCNHVTGVCDCLPGWEGFNCDTACDNNTFGNYCSSACPCVASNSLNASQSCDPVNGTCSCLETWAGDLCEIDVNECENDTVCNITNGGCYNFDGGYACSCYIGFVNISADCVIDTNLTTTTFSTQDEDSQSDIYVVFSYTIDPADDLNVPETYQQIKNEIRNALLSFFTNEMGGSLTEIIIIQIVRGSTIVNFTALYTNTEESASALTNAIYSLSQNTSLTLFNSTVYPLTVVINGVNVPINVHDSMTRCELFYQLKGCQSGYECVEAAGSVSCRDNSESDNLALIIGLAVGIPVGVIIIAIVAVVIYIYCVVRPRERTAHTDESPYMITRTKEPVEEGASSYSGESAFGGATSYGRFSYGRTSPYRKSFRLPPLPSIKTNRPPPTDSDKPKGLDF